MPDTDTDDSVTLKVLPNSMPPLPAGDYTLYAKLNVNKSDGSTLGTFDSRNEFTFTVAAPRFALDSSVIYSVYPSPGSSGTFTDHLPHIIFNSKTLPWERPIVPGSKHDSKPWLALLLLDEDEITSDVCISTIPITTTNGEDSFITPSSGTTYSPAITVDSWETAKSNLVKVLTLPGKVFKGVVPSISDLEFLAHVRQVDTSNKENAAANPKGWFSSVICNRTPTEKKSNTVFLVSLEGYESLISSLDTIDDSESIRLVLLHQWSFHNEGDDFSTLIQKIVSNTTPLRVDTSSLSATPEVQKALHYGYTPVNYDLRTGNKTVAWYRGPFAPVYMPDGLNEQDYLDADQALRFDKDTGMFDISYSSAWQLGRLLALQAPGYFKALSQWKATYKTDIPVNLAKQLVYGIVFDPGTEQNATNDAVLLNKANEVASNEILTDFMMELWNKNHSR